MTFTITLGNGRNFTSSFKDFQEAYEMAKQLAILHDHRIIGIYEGN